MPEPRGTPRRVMGEGAAEEAPTAPHATPRTGPGPRTGPERFWARWPVRVAFAGALVVSGLAHCAALPFELTRGFEIDEVDGEAAIPVDLLEPQDTPPPAEPPPPAEAKPSAEVTAAALRAAPHLDAGAPRDGGLDAGPDAARADAAAFDAGADGRDGAVALAEAGAAPGGPRDPQAIVGAAGDIQVDAVLVMVVVNAEVIRNNPEAAALARLLRGEPQWAEFIKGADIDPINDVDWILISGPSLVDTSRDVVLIRYSASEAKVARAMDVVARADPRTGGPFDAGVGSMKAVRAWADRAERVVLLPRPHVLAIVPSSAAARVARQLSRATVPVHIRKGEAAYVRVVNPHHPMPEIPASITEARLRVVPRDDAGVDLYLEGDTRTPEAARQAAAEVASVIARHNIPIVAMATQNLLGGAETTSEGTVVKVHIVASREQINTVIGLAAMFTPAAPAPRGSP